MTEFEGQIWAIQDNDDVNFICTSKRVKDKIQAINEKGRELRLSEDKLLWQHPNHVQRPEDWQNQLKSIQATVDSLRKEIDIFLLWESALELEISKINELADLYFGDKITTEHLTALWQTLANDRLHFKRKGKDWEARTAEQIEELKLQRSREQSRAQEIALATDWLQKLAKVPIPAFLNWSINQSGEEGDFKIMEVPEPLIPFVGRLEGWLLRGDSDKDVEELASRYAASVNLSTREFAFEILQKVGWLPPNADRDVIVAGLKPEFPESINEVVRTILPWLPTEEQNITPLLFSIDDEETREVDDALSIEREGLLWKITIAIADPARVIHRGDVLDREAMRRGTTVYLPTQTVLMLPERISCEIASLSAGQIRSSVVIRAWLDDQGQLTRSNISTEAIQVLRRLHYSDADKLIKQPDSGETAQHLRELYHCAKQLQARRQTEGALTLQRPEYKISITEGSNISVTMIERDSPSRLLVAEMMILANHIAAKYAQHHQVPLIYRVQDPPLEPITQAMTDDPLYFHKVRKLLGRSSLSLQPGGHSSLGLSVYTQLTSPLRRFADLVMQRQLVAHLGGDDLPYDQDELFKVLETAERTAREARFVEGEAKKRWLLQYLKQSWDDQPLDVLILKVVKNGYQVEIQPWGTDAFLSTSKILEVGQMVTAVTEKIRVKAANARLKLVT